MDWYFIGRIAGVLFWPALVATVLYGIGVVLALRREPQRAIGTRRWFRVIALVGFLVTLFITGRDFLKYTGTMP